MRKTLLASAAAVSALCATAAVNPAQPASAWPADKPYTFAVIGDVPYGAAQVAAFPAWIQQINRDPSVRTVVHLGDIKNGSTVCSDDYFALIRRDFDTFRRPLVYTPGDNEWTDCHRANNGGYNPLERLAKVRQVFFDKPGRTLGQEKMDLESQASRGLPENVIYHQARVTFVAANVPGSDNAMQPWTGNTAPTPEQVAAYQNRLAGDIALLHRAFAEAKARHDRGVVVEQQADMFDPTYTPTWNDIGHFQPWVQALIEEASAYDGPVYLMDGDSHAYNTDKPLAAGSPWLSTYQVSGSADNLTRVTVDGSNNNNDYLRVTINPEGSSSLLSWERVPYATPAT